jgi:uncharacterized membrane protein
VKHLRHYFLTGIAALLPVSVTGFLFYFIIKQAGSLFRPLLKRSVLLAPLPDWVATVMGFVFLLIIIIAVGAIASGVIGRYALGWFDKILRGIPIVREVYGSARQLTDAVFIQRSSLRKTVLAEYPSKGLFALGFVTTDEPFPLPDGRKALWVFFPTAPNPTTGWLAIVPLEDMTETGMAIEEGLKLVVSGGLLRPPGGTTYGAKPAELG